MQDDRISSYLLTGETVLWRGRPSVGLRLTWRDALLVPLGVTFAVGLFVGLRPFWTAEDLFAMAISVCFAGAAIFMVLGRFLIDCWLRSRTRYAVTDQRVLIARQGPLGAELFRTFADLPEVTMIEHRDGRGTLWFGPQPGLLALNRGLLSVNMAIEWGALLPSLEANHFYAVENARNVLSMIQSRRAKAAA